MFKPGSVPPFIDIDYTGCVMCDAELKESFGISVKSGNNNNANNNRPNVQPAAARGRGQGTAAGRGTGNSTISSRGRGQTTPNALVSNYTTAVNQENDPVCMCGQQAISLTVSKEGPNKG